MDTRKVEDIRQKLDGKTIYVIPYTHPDWSWCHTRQWHELRYIAVFEELLALLERDKAAVWYMDCFVTELLPLIERKPALLEPLRQAVKSGRVAVCGAFSNVRPNMVADEAYIRNLVIGRKRFDDVFPGVDLTVHADSVDVVLGHPQLPQLLKKAGYRYFRAGRPYGVLEKKGIPHGFVWEGLDKSAVLCWWAEYDAMSSQKTAVLLTGGGDWDETVCALYDRELKRFADNAPANLVWLPQASDDNLPLKTFNSNTDLDITGFIKKWNVRETSAIRYATPPVFFQALEKRADGLTVVKGTIDPCDVCYNVAWGGEKGLAPLRIKSAEAIADAEKWMTFASALDMGEYSETDTLWESNLTASAHASQWVFEEDRDALFSFAERALETASILREKAMRKITEALLLPDNTAAVVFNSHDKAVDTVIGLTLPCGDTQGLALCDGSGESLDFQILEPFEYSGKAWEHRLLVKIALPPSGVNIVAVKSGDISCRDGGVFVRSKKPELIHSDQPFYIDNGLIRLSFRNGNLETITDTETGAALDCGGVCWNTLEFTAIDTDKGGLHAGPETGRQRVKWINYVVTEAGPLRYRCVLSGSDGVASFTQTVTVEHGSRVIKFETHTDNYPVCAGYLAAKIPVSDSARLSGGIPFGSEEKDIDNEPYNDRETDWSDFHRQWDGLFFAKDFAAAKDERAAVALCHQSGDRYYRYDKNEGSLACLLINTAYPYKDTCEEYMNAALFQSPGAHTFRHAIIVAPTGTPDSSFINDAAALGREPVVMKPYRSLKQALFLPPNASYASVDSPNVVLSALYFEGTDIIARLWESAGRATDACLTLCAPISEATAENFIGEPDSSVTVKAKNNQIHFTVKPHEIVTLRLVPAT